MPDVQAGDFELGTDPGDARMISLIAGVDDDGVLEPGFAGGRTFYDVFDPLSIFIEDLTDAFHYLECDLVQMDGMGVGGKIIDDPVFGNACGGGLGGK